MPSTILDYLKRNQSTLRYFTVATAFGDPWAPKEHYRLPSFQLQRFCWRGEDTLPQELALDLKFLANNLRALDLRFMNSSSIHPAGSFYSENPGISGLHFPSLKHLSMSSVALDGLAPDMMFEFDPARLLSLKLRWCIGTPALLQGWLDSGKDIRLQELTLLHKGEHSPDDEAFISAVSRFLFRFQGLKDLCIMSDMEMTKDYLICYPSQLYSPSISATTQRSAYAMRSRNRSCQQFGHPQKPS